MSMPSCSRPVAGGAERYFFAPTADDLAAIYQQLSEAVGEVVATDLSLIDLMGPDVLYVDSSAQPPPANALPTELALECAGRASRGPALYL